MMRLMILVKCSLSYGEHTPPPPRERIRKCFPWINLIVEAHRDRRFFWSSSFIGFFLASMDILNEPKIFYIVRRHTCGFSCCHRWWWWSRKAEATISANHHQDVFFGKKLQTSCWGYRSCHLVWCQLFNRDQEHVWYNFKIEKAEKAIKAKPPNWFKKYVQPRKIKQMGTKNSWPLPHFLKVSHGNSPDCGWS